MLQINEITTQQYVKDDQLILVNIKLRNKI